MPFGELRPGDAVRIRTERWRVVGYMPHGAAASVEVVGAADTNRGARATFLLPFEPLERLAACETPRTVRPTAWRAIARAAIGAATPCPHALRAAARAGIAIVPFQLEPALALLSGRGCRLLIADAVGLGKTIQAGLVIAELLARERAAHVLVVCPAGLREQWRGELEARFGLRPVILDAATIAAFVAAHGSGVHPWTMHPLVITSIDYVKRPDVIRALETLIWDAVIFDEAHALAGASDRATVAASLGRRARWVVLLTATPHSGNEDAFRRMCGIGRLDDGAPLLVFRRTRGDAGIGGERHEITLPVRTSASESAVHEALAAYARRVQPRAQLAMSVLLRRACSSAGSLARSVERRLEWLRGRTPEEAQLALPFDDRGDNDDEPSAVLATTGLDDRDEEQRVLQHLLDLAHRAAARESKVVALERLLRRAAQPALVFTEYRDTLTHLAECLHGRAAMLHGGMTIAQRRAAVQAFTAGTADLLLATDAASEGLNLHQRCRLVINLELPWTPLRLEQRVGRVDRIGQSRRVHAVHLVARGTSEEGVAARLSRRRGRATDAMTVPPDMVLRDEAEREAARLRTARRLLNGHARTATRPALCRLRSRTRPAAGRFWTWTVTFTDRDGRPLWDSLVTVRAERGLHVDKTTLDLIAQQAEDCQLAALACDTRDLVVLLARREHAIAGALRERHARLAATLLQPGLFDRRAERAAAAQAALMNDALTHMADRLRRVEAAQHPRVDERRLVFAVTLD